jgi:hypothetical protein
MSSSEVVGAIGRYKSVVHDVVCFLEATGPVRDYYPEDDYHDIRRRDHDHPVSVSIDEDTVVVAWVMDSEYRLFGSETFPLAWLLGSEDERRQITQDCLNFRAGAKLARTTQYALDREITERQTYEKLKAKFEQGMSEGRLP